MKIEKPIRASHCYEQHINASCEDVFPLLCPVRECDWVEGWEPLRVISQSGVVEDGCVFVMPGDPVESTWIVTEHAPAELRLAMVESTPGELITRLWISLRQADDGCVAEVRYEYTALNKAGEAFVSGMDEKAYQAFMREWESEMNRYFEGNARASSDAPCR